ncbi:hypothetical protein Tco_1042758 [Tanacetum coccineum]|uniref:Reverse transcriptase domain-containing protein n=1 Tax=Tanacetum coccineum TaxID=301880 RepID=A0ABQ5GK10_9ASTR
MLKRSTQWLSEIHRVIAIKLIKATIRLSHKRRKALEFSVYDLVLASKYRLGKKDQDGVHDTFHVSNLKKCLADPTLQVPLDKIRVDTKVNFVEEPVNGRPRIGGEVGGGGETLGGGDVGRVQVNIGRCSDVDEVGVDLEALEMEALVDAIDVDNG